MGQGSYHSLCHYRDALVSALLVQHWRHPGQVVQMDLRQDISLSHLSRSGASTSDTGATQGKGAHPRAVFGESATYLEFKSDPREYLISFQRIHRIPTTRKTAHCRRILSHPQRTWTQISTKSWILKP